MNTISPPFPRNNISPIELDNNPMQEPTTIQTPHQMREVLSSVSADFIFFATNMTIKIPSIRITAVVTIPGTEWYLGGAIWW